VVVKPAPHVLFQEIGGETVLLDLEAERYYGLDAVGSRFWSLLAGDGDVDSVISRLLAEFDVEEARVRADIAALVAQLEGAGLIVTED
jgi:hypothetical protein